VGQAPGDADFSPPGEVPVGGLARGSEAGHVDVERGSVPALVDREAQVADPASVGELAQAWVLREVTGEDD
jgi:hypothetical protein